MLELVCHIQRVLMRVKIKADLYFDSLGPLENILTVKLGHILFAN